MLRYPIPTHLRHEAPLIPASGYLPVDLTFRQAMLLAGAGVTAYWAWGASGWPWPLALLASLAALAVAGLAAFLTVGGRSADLWLRDWLLFHARPQVRVWQPLTSPATEPPPGHWAEEPLQVTWAPATGADHQPSAAAAPVQPAAAGSD